MRWPWTTYMGNLRLGHAATCPYPSQCPVMRKVWDHRQMLLQKSRQILHTYRMNHWQADPRSDSPWQPGVESPTSPMMPDSPQWPGVESPWGLPTQGLACLTNPLLKHRAGVTNVLHQCQLDIPSNRPARWWLRECKERKSRASFSHCGG